MSNLRKMILMGAAVMAAPLAALAASPAASDWQIGPVIKGRNYSVGMPPYMEPGRDGPGFDFPYPSASDGHVHYVTVPVRSLEGARSISLTYRIDAAPDVRFVAQQYPDQPAIPSLYFQRAGDRWTARTPHHRWYSPINRAMPLEAGTHTVTIALDEPWKAMMGGDATALPAQFERAKAEAAVVGFVFGSSGGRGHGVFATGPARFTVLDFVIE
ncbi:MAG: hypothetical protein KJZ64_02555 [Sphingomonadaceae bacterium]|nr:hypothetical protein [Sphingomonadaceae bacterium]